MIPQPTVSRFVSRAMMPASTVEDLRLHAVLAPPRVGLGEPDRVEPGLVHDARRLEHLLQRLHRQLHHADAERDASCRRLLPSCFSSALMMPSTCWLMIGCSTRWPIDASTPASLTSASQRHVRVVALAAQRERRRHVHHRADALALAAHRARTRAARSSSCSKSIVILSPPSPSGTLTLARQCVGRRRPRSPRRRASAPAIPAGSLMTAQTRSRGASNSLVPSTFMRLSTSTSARRRSRIAGGSRRPGGRGCGCRG